MLKVLVRSFPSGTKERKKEKKEEEEDLPRAFNARPGLPVLPLIHAGERKRRGRGKEGRRRKKKKKKGRRRQKESFEGIVSKLASIKKGEGRKQGREERREIG